MNPSQTKVKSPIDSRNDFPSLKRTIGTYPLMYFDGPGGTQIPTSVIEAMVYYYHHHNANTHGFFITTRESDQCIETAREKMAVFLGAEGPDQISFGANMTTLAYSLSNAFGRAIRSGEEVLITQLDHEANRGPWLKLEENGIVVKEVNLLADGTLDYDDFNNKISAKTRLVAMGLSSNALGTVNDTKKIIKKVRSVGAWLLVDAVHYAPHFPIDVLDLDVDFLLCSAYKFYGPHVGILYSRKGLLDQLETDRLRTQDAHAPYRIETGTLNHAAIAGVAAAVDYIATFGRGTDLRGRIIDAMETIHTYENNLAAFYYGQVKKVDGISVYGPDFTSAFRAPTVSVSIEGHHPESVCEKLGNKGICVWDGNFYAIRPIEILGLLERGGVTRMGISVYNTKTEVEFLLQEISKIAREK